VSGQEKKKSKNNVSGDRLVDESRFGVMTADQAVSQDTLQIETFTNPSKGLNINDNIRFGGAVSTAMGTTFVQGSNVTTANRIKTSDLH
jgi:hypothetical protein